jgi:undecaprenyl-diphosphatase
VLAWDRHLERWVVSHRVGFLNPVFEALSYAGTYGAVWLGIGLVLALVAHRRAIFIWTLAAFAVAELSTDLLKATIPRSRPHVDALVPRPHTHSFPSGHAAIAFACATVLGAAAPRLRAPLYVLAAAIAWSRAYDGVHYPLDVLAGAIIGAALGYGLVRLWRATGRRARAF